MIEIRPLRHAAPHEEFGKVAELDVTEEGSVVYAWRDGRMVSAQEEWRRPPLTSERTAQIIAEWPAIVEAGGVVLGALDGERLAGVAVLVPRLSDAPTPGTAQLYYLHVSRPYRRQGVATRLVREIIRRARESGARELYVSATPSPSALSFYGSFGFVPVAEPHPRLFALEPEDIHMHLVLDDPEGDAFAPIR